MARALQPAVKTGEIFFELDRFELGEGDRLELSGRWFGVRGRRFVRPSLALICEHGPMRALADLEHKPWATEDGEWWEAAFPWREDSDVLEAELSVAPDITILLPIPGTELSSAQRISVRRRTRGPASEAPERDTDARATDSVPPRPRVRGADAATPPENEVETLRDEVSGLRGELGKLRAELEAAQIASAESANATAAASMDLAAAEERRDAALSGMQAAIAARDAAVRARDELARERDHERDAREQLAHERERVEQAARKMRGELQQARSALESAVDERQEATRERDRVLGERDSLLHTGQRLTRQRDDAVAARGAALVMRNATRAMPHHDHEFGWLQRAIAIVVLVGVMFALLIVAHVL